ncbi:extracellular solute-binding protein [Dichotomicrobium thermohalophilum]|uniref:Peptide/nickel transport system substrate-binding protein n=1 Tax=Dichotomicrobium thermohalophilum TaxID=933063 RepID=A0A397Q4J2_9HYPH|nr:extracellular solute-binding protein [Dichotomicrobium thermohalophilum]RIA55329.1 peptide/nickel transport system substrate-binding protein [Dichotomicrobium thermohalophilum]
MTAHTRQRTQSMLWAGFIALIAGMSLGLSAAAEPRHGIAMHGDPKYGPDFKAFDYVNPDAPKGGKLVRAVQGSFDSLNPLIIKGEAAPGMRQYVYESLMARAQDEPFSLYGLLAESIETPPDRSWVAFTLREEARFSDGEPVTVEDVIFSHALLRDRGRPNHQFYYAKVEKVEKTGPRTVKFTFNDEGDREMPLIMGLMPVLPEHAIDPETFEETTLEPPVGSGPYVVSEVDPGSRITFARDPDYWGRDLPVNRGHYNFDKIQYDFYRDANAMFEAFKKGVSMFMTEADPGQWAREYEFPAVREGKVLRKEFDLELPAGMNALVFNTRREVFADERVRRALIKLFDFEWMNAKLFHGLYERSQSYFARSELSAHGKPADPREQELLAPFPDAVDPAIMKGTYSLPKSDGSGRNRKQLRAALKLLREAGYELKGGRLVNARTGKPMQFEILAADPEQERLLLTYTRALKRAGIEATVRIVDSAQYQRRKQTYDFDMIQNRWPSSLSPGNEQTFRWSSKAAEREGTFNYAGVKNESVDAMIAAMLSAKSREDFVSAVRALDRVLMSGHYVIPLFHLPKLWVAHWHQLQHPETPPFNGVDIDTWWMATDLAEAQ